MPRKTLQVVRFLLFCSLLLLYLFLFSCRFLSLLTLSPPPRWAADCLYLFIAFNIVMRSQFVRISVGGFYGRHHHHSIKLKLNIAHASSARNQTHFCLLNMNTNATTTFFHHLYVCSLCILCMCTVFSTRANPAADALIYSVNWKEICSRHQI